MSEPHAGSALTDLTTKAEEKDGNLVLNGMKRWCSGAGHAQGYVVYCRMSDEPGAKGIGAVYVEKDAEGLTFGKQEELMGFNGVPSADIFFDNVKVPKESIVVEANGGFKKLMEAFDLERCGNATMSLGQAAVALDQVLEYVQEREQFGKPIVDFQAVQLKLAEMAMKVEASRLLIHRAAHNAAEGLPSIFESSVGKCFSNEMAREVTGTAIQLMGGYGYNKEYQMERRFRDAWGWGIAGGTIDIQKINIAASLVGRRFNQRKYFYFKEAIILLRFSTKLSFSSSVKKSPIGTFSPLDVMCICAGYQGCFGFSTTTKAQILKYSQTWLGFLVPFSIFNLSGVKVMISCL